MRINKEVGAEIGIAKANIPLTADLKEHEDAWVLETVQGDFYHEWEKNEKVNFEGFKVGDLIGIIFDTK